METMYVIQDNTGYVVGAAYEVSKAIEICKANDGYSYRLVPFYKEATTHITIVNKAPIK